MAVLHILGFRLLRSQLAGMLAGLAFDLLRAAPECGPCLPACKQVTSTFLGPWDPELCLKNGCGGVSDGCLLSGRRRGGQSTALSSVPR